MTAGKCETTRCGLCRFYSHEGRRGGLCHQLNVNVDSHWKACGLAESPFVEKAKPVLGIAKLVAATSPEVPVVPLANEPTNVPASVPFSAAIAQAVGQ